MSYVIEHLKVARFVADQQGHGFLVYLIEMAVAEGTSHLPEAAAARRRALDAVPAGDAPSALKHHAKPARSRC
ncbi:hypothetical protein [Stappia sp. MMSF_3263]|uniref:hypothetical protein n=1 Tax=Stappia sp. MMSF_3263 TaxID=3046693 RepID=UPI00273D2229|nr:hypothetical protein [Stappia sp. MMSF_3263]